MVSRGSHHGGKIMPHRNYRKEYRDFHGTPKQIRNRATRNKARADSSLGKGDRREIDHIKPLSKGGSNKNNTRITTRHINRKKAAR